MERKSTDDGAGLIPGFNPDQIILIDKPANITSFGVVARVRRQLSVAAGHRVKVGHCGTLDPFATGLLILVSGKNTHRAIEFAKCDKVYRATIRLGVTSSMGDPEGQLTEHYVSHPPTDAEVCLVVNDFTGRITQTPPIYSAIKIDGRRAYDLARAGRLASSDMPERQVDIYSIDIDNYSYPYLTITTHVSSGTYIRSLAEDIGRKLGTGAYTTILRRLRVGNYSVEQAIKLDDHIIDQLGTHHKLTSCQ